MATAVTVRADFSADELRRLAAASKHANQTRRQSAGVLPSKILKTREFSALRRRGRRSIDQLRGIEGARVRAMYDLLAQRHGVAWKRRAYDPHDWDISDT